MADPLPIGVTASQLTAARDNLRCASAPARDADHAVLIGHLMTVAKLARITVEDWAAVTATYRAALHDVPGDLLTEAGARLMRRWDNGYRLPLPAEIRALVADEMGRRLSGLARVQAALMTTQRMGPRCETRAEAAARRQERARMIDEAARPDTRCPVEMTEEENEE